MCLLVFYFVHCIHLSCLIPFMRVKKIKEKKKKDNIYLSVVNLTLQKKYC